LLVRDLYNSFCLAGHQLQVTKSNHDSENVPCVIAAVPDGTALPVVNLSYPILSFAKEKHTSTMWEIESGELFSLLRVAQIRYDSDMVWQIAIEYELY
jgi:hypothetical protein